MRSTPDLDRKLMERLKEAVDKFDGGSADAFGRRIGYANGGYIRECLRADPATRKPVREKLIDRVHATPELAGWFDPVLAANQFAPSPAAREESIWLAALRAIRNPRARAKVLGYAQGVADAQDGRGEDEPPVFARSVEAIDVPPGLSRKRPAAT